MRRKLISITTPMIVIGLFASFALLISFAYFGALLNPYGNIHDMPLAIVVKDTGAVTPQGQSVNFGQVTLKNILDQHNNQIKWSVESSREAAINGIHKNSYAGAIVIPADYSTTILQLISTGGMSGTPAHIEILTNTSTGTLADSTAQRIENSMIGTISQSVHQQAVLAAQAAALQAQQAAQAGHPVTLPQPDAAAQYVLSDPVKPTITPVQPVDPKAAIGLAPMYLAVAMTIIGLLGANIINTGVDIARSLLRRTAPVDTLSRPSSRLAVWGIKFGLITLAAVIAGLIVAWMTIDVLGMTTHHAWELAFFTMLGIEVNCTITLILVANIGLAGTLGAVIFTTVFGVPTSGGVYPLQMVPNFFTWLGGWLPMRYMVDGVRSLLYFNAQMDAGLGKALWVLGGYTVGIMLAGTLIAAARDYVARRHNVTVSDWIIEIFRSTPQIAVD
jgi:YhgE/Pip-like protein